MSRIDTLCPDCGCFYPNCDEEVVETMDREAPGVDCTHELDTNSNDPCPCYYPMDGIGD